MKKFASFVVAAIAVFAIASAFIPAQAEASTQSTNMIVPTSDAIIGIPRGGLPYRP
jgi:hypothetical protein